MSSRRTAEEDTPGVRLLADIRTVFDEVGPDRLSSADLVERLCALEEAPWGDLRGKPIVARTLASRLRPFDVRPDCVRFDCATRKGYRRE